MELILKKQLLNSRGKSKNKKIKKKKTSTEQTKCEIKFFEGVHNTYSITFWLKDECFSHIPELNVGNTFIILIFIKLQDIAKVIKQRNLNT